MALRLGATLADIGKLMRWTLRYHVANHLPAARSNETGDVVCIVNGQRVRITLRPTAGDIFTLYEVLAREVYRLPSGITSRVRTIVDLGANIGLTSLYYSTLLSEIQVVCVEPHPESFRLLTLNGQQNGFAWHTVPCAVGAMSGLGTLSVHRLSQQHHLADIAPAGAISVRVKRMAELLEDAGLDEVDLLKVDIEGGETALFSEDASWLKRVRVIIVEFHPGLVDYPRIAQRVVKYGFRFYQAATATALFPGAMDVFIREGW